MRFKHIYYFMFALYLSGWVILAFKVDWITYFGLVGVVGGGLVSLLVFLHDNFILKARNYILSTKS